MVLIEAVVEAMESERVYYDRCLYAFRKKDGMETAFKLIEGHDGAGGG